MKIDLSIGAELPTIISIKIDEVAKETRKDFTRIISEISHSRHLKNNIDWWVESPASRNTIASPLFYYLCGIRLIDRLIKENQSISEVIVDSFAMKNIIRKLLLKYSIRIPVRGPNNSYPNRLHRILKNFEIVISTLKNKLYILKCSRKTKYLQKPIHSGPLTLIGTFALPGHISKDRYYNGLWKNLSNEKRSLTYFVPTLISIPLSDITSAYKELRESDRNFLIKEDFLNINDIIYSILHCFRVFFLKVKKVSFLGCDISLLIKEELQKFKEYSNAVDALLNYRFSKSLKNQRIKLRLVVNWFENQAIDKGWNAGFSFFYPKIQTTGYRGYVTSDFYLCTLPSECENINNILPKKIAVIGEKLCKSTMEFDSGITIKLAPALRFSHLWNDYNFIPNNNYYTIFFAMPNSWLDSEKIFKSLVNNLDYLEKNNIRVIVKRHPTMSVDFVHNMVAETLSNIFLITEESFIDCLLKSNLLISGMSGAVIESIVFGIPTLLIRNNSGITFNPIPNNIPKGIWEMCDNSDQIIDYIIYYRNLSTSKLKDYKILGEKIRRDYFEPVTKKNVYRFLELKLN